jgi:hypothetical protein
MFIWYILRTTCYWLHKFCVVTLFQRLPFNMDYNYSYYYFIKIEIFYIYIISFILYTSVFIIKLYVLFSVGVFWALH